MIDAADANSPAIAAKLATSSWMNRPEPVRPESKSQTLLPAQTLAPSNSLNALEHAPPIQGRFDHRERYHANRHDELQAVLGKPLQLNPNYSVESGFGGSPKLLT